MAAEPVWDREVDVAVFGSGAGGMAAALACALEGLDVALFEKVGTLGGTTSNSGGGIWVPLSTQARKAGIDDTPERVRTYLKHELGQHYDAPLIEAFLQTGAEAIDYFGARSEVQFQLAPYPDYHTDAPGGVTTGRTLFPPAFDGRRLGRDFDTLRAPRQRFMVLGGMMVGRRDIPALLAPFSSWANFRSVAAMLLRYGADRLRYRRGTNLLIGNALAARFLFSLRRQGVAIQTGSPLRELVTGGQGVEGAVVDGPDGPLRVRARLGVVVATGGFPHNAALRESLAPAYPHRHSAAYEQSLGEGLTIAQRAGAAVLREVASPCFWTPASIVREDDGTEVVFPYGHLDRGKPGAILVNAGGRRFVNEADSYHDVVMAAFNGPDREANLRSHLVCDSLFMRSYGMGVVRPHSRRLDAFVRSGYLIRGATLGELAQRIGVDAAALQETVALHNRYAETGVDLSFAKGQSAFNKFNGDPSCQPNPCLRAIAEAPFYALPVHPASIGTSLGINTDPDARALDAGGNPIPGLYVCGNDMASIMRGQYPGPGITLGPAIVFGYRAAMHMAARNRAAQPPRQPTSSR